MIALGILLIGATAGLPEFKVEPAPELEALFKRDSGWIGADADYSVPLGKDTTLWLFGDTFVGKVKDGRRVDAVMVNNSIGIQRLDKAGQVEFHYRTGMDGPPPNPLLKEGARGRSSGKPASFFTPTDNRGYLWPLDGVLTKRGLFIFLLRVEPDTSNPVFPFRTFGTSLAHIRNPHDSPNTWKITQCDIPYCRFGKGESIYFGCSVVEHDGWLYVYGLDSPIDNGKKRPHVMVLARVKPDRLDKLSEWRFYSGGKWIEDFTKCEPLAEGLTTEYSVRRIFPPRSLGPRARSDAHKGLDYGPFVVVYTEGGILGNIMIRLAPRPEGPWSEPVKLYECPEKSWHKRAYCYAAKVHPELSRSPDELIITYAANSMDFADLFDDARLYWPRFVRVTLIRGPVRKGTRSTD